MIEGKSGSICCEVNSSLPVLSTIWMKTNRTIQRKNNNTNCFEFSPLHRNDSGHFTCLAKTQFSSLSLSTELNIVCKFNFDMSRLITQLSLHNI